MAIASIPERVGLESQMQLAIETITNRLDTLSLEKAEHAKLLDEATPFTTKHTYIVWRRHWKRALAVQIQLVHSERTAMQKRYGDPLAQSLRHKARILGRNLHLLRSTSKIKAGQQYEARR